MTIHSRGPLVPCIDFAMPMKNGLMLRLHRNCAIVSLRICLAFIFRSSSARMIGYKWQRIDRIGDLTDICEARKRNARISRGIIFVFSL